MNAVTNQFAKNFFTSLLGKIILFSLGIAYWVILTRFLGVDELGEYTFILLFPLSIQMLTSSGFGIALTCFIAEKKNQNEKIHAYIWSMWLCTSILMVIISLLTLFVYSRFKSDLSLNFCLFTLLLPPIINLNYFKSAAIHGLQRYSDLVIYSSISSVLKTGILLSAFLIFQVNSSTALYSYLTEVIISQFVISYILNNRQFKRVRFSFISYLELKEIIRFGFQTQLSHATTFLTYKSDQWIIALLINKSALGLYSTAIENAEKLWRLIAEFSSVLLPFVSENKENLKLVTKFITKSSSVLWSFLLLVGVIGGFLSKFIIGILYGKEFQPSAEVIWFLLPGVIILGHNRIISNFLTGIGQPKINTTAALYGLVVNLALNAYLIPKHGIKGAAIATSISYIAIAFIKVKNFCRITGVHPKVLYIPKLKYYTELYTVVKTAFLEKRNI